MLQKDTTAALDKAELAERTLLAIVAQAQATFGEELVAALVFGSAANKQLRLTSDVNLMLVLQHFHQQQVDEMRESLRIARALVELHVMFITQAELPTAAKTFAMKFADIQHRHRVLYGKNPLADVVIGNDDLIANTRQTLLNFQLRTREQYVISSLREEQLVQVIADAAGPLRSCAAALRQISGSSYLPAKIALEEFAKSQPRVDLVKAVQAMSTAREQEFLTPGTAATILINLLDLSHLMYEQL